MSEPRYTAQGDFVSDSGMLLLCVVRGTMAERGTEAAEIAAKLEAHDKLVAALQDARVVLKQCADDTAGTPTHGYFEDEVNKCDAALYMAERLKAEPVKP